MKSWISSLAVGGAMALTAASASATVLTFDDLGSDGYVADFASGHYGGLDWSAGNWLAFGEVQDPYTAHSGEFRAVSGFEESDAATSIGFGAASTFQGAWFSGLTGATVTFELFYQGVQVATSATLNPNATPQFLASGYAGLVDHVIVASPGQGSYAMDDFTFAQAVPEPQTWALMVAGLGVVGFCARRRKSLR